MDLFQGSDLSEIAWGFFVGALGLAMPIWGLCWAFHFFIALRARPIRRAIWNVGPAFVLTVACAELLVGQMRGTGHEVLELAFLLPVIAFPGALIAFWYLRSNYVRLWVESPENLPEGVSIANDDWRVGLMFVLAALATSIAFAVARKLPVILALRL